MKGHIRKRSNSSWAIVIDLGRDAKGKRRQKWHSVKGNKRDAEAELARLLNDVRLGEYIEPSKMSLSDYLDRWLSDYARPRVSPKTFERYDQIVQRSIKPAIGNLTLSKLKPMHIQSFYADALVRGRADGRGGLSAQTVLHFHRLLHKALGQAVRWQLLTRNPAAAVEPPRTMREEMRALDEEETAQLFRETSETSLFLPVLLAVTGGLRRGEILALKWEDLDLNSGHAAIVRSLEQTREGLRFKSPKTARGRRTIVFPDYALKILAAHRVQQGRRRLSLGVLYDDQGLVVARDDGSPWPPNVFSTAFAAYVRRSALKHFRFHDLRHTHASQLLRQGVHPKIVSERLGHSNISITLDTYSHVLPGMQEDAIATFNQRLLSFLDGNQ